MTNEERIKELTKALSFYANGFRSEGSPIGYEVHYPTSELTTDAGEIAREAIKAAGDNFENWFESETERVIKKLEKARKGAVGGTSVMGMAEDALCIIFHLQDQLEYKINMPKSLHTDTKDLVAKFAEAMAEKLNRVQGTRKGGPVEWMSPSWKGAFKALIHKSIEKGDPVDLAIWSAFGYYHGWNTKKEAKEVFPCEIPELIGKKK